MVVRFADNTDPESFASRLRQARNRRFRVLLDRLPRPLSILDVGGSVFVWRQIGLADDPAVAITLFNLDPLPSKDTNITPAAGDARDMRQFADASFDVVYSNSVIEHVGGPDDVAAMAREIRRVGRSYYVQTPNKHFPIEPHFVFPWFQYLPQSARVALVRRFELGWEGRHPDAAEARALVDSIRLLSRRELRKLFPDATITAERVAGLPKSLVAYRFAGTS